MLCENCKQKPATLHFTKIMNGQKSEYHLCEQCAKDKGEEFPYDQSGFSFDSLLSGLLNFDPTIIKGHQIPQNPSEVRCSTCGLTFPSFKKAGKFGCHDCYSHFESHLEPILRRVHGNSQHIGKVPQRSGETIKLKKEIIQLKDLLQQKVMREEFEDAAKLRDQIKDLESKLLERRG